MQSTTSPRVVLCTLAVLSLLVGPVVAQTTAPTSQPATQPGEWDEWPNVGHTRHHHARNPKHPAAPDGARFTTSRPEALQLPLPKEEGAFTFAVFGDRTGGPATGVAVLADAVRDVNLVEPDLVMTVGDLVQGYNQDGPWLEQMREYKNVMNKLLCPWFPVAGNHDIYWRGPAELKPKGEHEKLYEMNFGPLWYAFRHKNCVFVALFSDEGNPETGEKAIGKPESQKISPEQFAWLKKVLADNKDADHIFLFLHHPRWLGTIDAHGGYGDDWQKVHEELKNAGNVTAVFAGHIHTMRYDQKDGIEYVTLATTGGGQSGVVPQAGFLHHYHLVTVRKKQVAMAAFPVGQAMDVREITGEMVAQVRKLATEKLAVDGKIVLRKDGGADGEFSVTLKNTADRDIDATVAPESADSRWTFRPDHSHGVIKQGESRTFTFRVRRPSNSLDEFFRPALLAIDAEYLAPSFRYQIPRRDLPVPLDLANVKPPAPDKELAVRFNGKDQAILIPSAELVIKDGSFTVECWMNADQFADRTGLLCKTQSSDYGIFVNNGRPQFSVYLGDGYATVRGKPNSLTPGQWHHVAGVYEAEGNQVRLYVDGKLVASGTRPGARKNNDLPLVIGGDVDGQGLLDSPFAGKIDSVRVSKGVRYKGDAIETLRRYAPDADTLLLLNFDGKVGPWVVDESPAGRTLTPQGDATIVPAE